MYGHNVMGRLAAFAAMAAAAAAALAQDFSQDALMRLAGVTAACVGASFNGLLRALVDRGSTSRAVVSGRTGATLMVAAGFAAALFPHRSAVLDNVLELAAVVGGGVALYAAGTAAARSGPHLP